MKTITITRTYDAPRELVFKAWLQPEHIVQWYHAGGGWTTPYAESDAKAGGALRIGFASPDGKQSFDLEGRYDEIIPSSRIAYTMADGRPVTIDLEESGGRTRLTLVLALEDTNSAEQQRDGWTEMLVNLETYLARF